MQIAQLMTEADPWGAVRRMVRERLENARQYDWSVHGIGMMRTYLDPSRAFRLNLWHPCLINPGISTMHTHPWPFTSYIIAGRLQNTRFLRAPEGAVGLGELWQEGRIECGPGYDGMRGEPKQTHLLRQPTETYVPGTSYKQQPDEIHDTAAHPGTITLIHRGEMIPGCEASVFWPLGQQWGDASRKFDWADADKTIATALRILETVED